ncbi:ARM repeat-containing protein [Conidiobolus coronatus NRRL 28638]|uniref:MMS19 nucleotide excision repair protein n=1 Tax=Conidiobolus coronatus (strain ATCC 28846 / CBS 209.66 / NRRL 28638) TaxID=796925 RepID=A0A137NSS3_CONC2|nr:ARM repeat-containing protein [Conidiobolus coronatus NRRL 28638]|eukprot:KXN65752.1 ARM repeat-containing protein [Conidiobolus coronatus NRRL 28638]
MDTVINFIHQYIVALDNGVIDKVVEVIELTLQELTSGRVALLGVVRQLENFLTSEDSNLRVKGLGFLTEILSKYPADALTKQEVTQFTSFLISRLSDQFCIKEILQGIEGLTRSSKFLGYECNQVLVELFSNLNVQSLSQPLRFSTLKLINQLIDQHPEVIVTMKSLFLNGFISAIDGEKDPRNLELVFQLVYKVAKICDITKVSEDLFDTIFCYFPITFKSPKDDPFGVSPNELKLGLKSCIGASPLFAPYAIPSLAEKLSSNSVTAKKDTLNVLIEVIDIYNQEAFTAQLEEVVENIKEEVYHPMDDEIQTISLSMLKKLFSKIYSKGNSQTSTHAFNLALWNEIDNLITEAISIFDVPVSNESAIKPAGKILSQLCGANVLCSCLILDKALVKLLDAFDQVPLIQLKRDILDVVVNILTECRLLFKAEKSGPDGDFIPNELLNQQHRLCTIFDQYFSQKNMFLGLRKSSANGFAELILAKQVMDTTERNFCLHTLTNALLNEQDKTFKQYLIKIFETLIEELPELISEICFPSIITHNNRLIGTILTNNLSGHQEHLNPEQSAQLKEVISLVTVFSVDNNTACCLLESVLSLVTNTLKKPYTFTSIAIVNSLVQSIQTILENLSAKQHNSKTSEIFNSTLLQLWNISYHFLISPEYPGYYDQQRLTVKQLFHSIYRVFILIIRKLETPLQQLLLTSVHKLFFDNENNGLINLDSKLDFKDFLSPFNGGNRFDNLIYLYAATVVASRPNIVLPFEATSHIRQLIEFVLQRGGDFDFNPSGNRLKSAASPITEPIFLIIASIVNKYFNDNECKYISDNCALTDLKYNAFDTTSRDFKRVSNIQLITWITKALIVRGHKSGFDLLNTLIVSLEDPVIGPQSAQALHIILDDDSWGLSKKNTHDVKFLFKQRVFTYSLPPLIQGFTDGKSEAMLHNHLLAISALLKNAPKSALVSEGPNLLPLIIASLYNPDAQLQQSSLYTLLVIIEASTSLVAYNSEPLIGQLLILSNFNTCKNMRVRMSALKSLHQISLSFPKENLEKHQDIVLKSLKVCLDDPKRLVRKLVVDCRNRWYMVLANRGA